MKLILAFATAAAATATNVAATSYYGWMPHNASFGFLDLTPSILLLRQFWD
jgi:hypothetical protein